MKVYTAPQSDPGFITLQADVATWRAMLGFLPVVTVVSYRKARGEKISSGSWRDATVAVGLAIEGREDSEVVRIGFDPEIAAEIVEISKRNQ